MKRALLPLLPLLAKGRRGACPPRAPLSGVPDAIHVEFTKLDGYARRPIAHICGCVLELPSTYDTYAEFRTEFTNILAAGRWQNDIIWIVFKRNWDEWTWSFYLFIYPRCCLIRFVVEKPLCSLLNEAFFVPRLSYWYCHIINLKSRLRWWDILTQRPGGGNGLSSPSVFEMDHRVRWGRGVLINFLYRRVRANISGPNYLRPSIFGVCG